MGANGHTPLTPDHEPDDLADDGAAGIDEVEPPPGLRDRIMAAALAARPPGQTVDSTDRGGDSDLPSPVEVHRGEQQRALLFLRGLGADDWGHPVDPPEFVGWTVHDVAAHLAANATLLADILGVPVPGVPETSGDNDARTAAAQARHRALPPSVALAEIDAAARAVDAAVTGLDDDGLDELIDWWGAPTSIRWALTVRAFETWTHTDDIRRALGRPMRPPPRASLRTMSRAACALMPLMLAARGEHRAGHVVRVRFSDVADAAWDVDLGEAGEARPAGVAPVDAELRLDAIDLCRAVGARMPAGGLTYTSTGDADLARSVVDAIPALAML